MSPVNMGFGCPGQGEFARLKLYSLVSSPPLSQPCSNSPASNHRGSVAVCPSERQRVGRGPPILVPASFWDFWLYLSAWLYSQSQEHHLGSRTLHRLNLVPFFLFFKFSFVLKYRHLTTSWYFQGKSERAQQYMYLHPFSPKLPSHPGCHITLGRAPCAIK